MPDPPARTATPRAVHDHRVAFTQAGDARAEGGDVAGVLVAERERQVIGQRPHRAIHQVQVRMAGAGRADLDHTYPGPASARRPRPARVPSSSPLAAAHACSSSSFSRRPRPAVSAPRHPFRSHPGGLLQRVVRQVLAGPVVGERSSGRRRIRWRTGTGGRRGGRLHRAELVPAGGPVFRRRPPARRSPRRPSAPRSPRCPRPSASPHRHPPAGRRRSRPWSPRARRPPVPGPACPCPS